MAKLIYDFRSDNVSGIIPEVLEALIQENQRLTDTSYGDDEVTKKLEGQLANFFNHEVMVFPIISGTAANALALATITPPYGAIYCHEQAHIQVHECGASEFFTGGAKLVLVPGSQGKIEASILDQKLQHGGKGERHSVQPAAVSITQASECGTVYQPAEIAAIGKIVKKHGLSLHMDGARFANALAYLKCQPADITWKAGVDVLCLGATKAGAMAAETVVFFNRQQAESFGFRWQRAGHVLSKMRFISCQLQAFWQKGVWDKYANHANQMAQLLAIGLKKNPSVKLLYPVEINEIFAWLPQTLIDHLLAQGAKFYIWQQEAKGAVIRLVTSFITTKEMVNGFLGLVKNIN